MLNRVPKLVCLSAVFLLAANLFAAAPTGTVDLSYLPANSDGSCPASAGAHLFSVVSLDGSGQGSTSGSWMTGAAGAYCIFARYNGDSSDHPSDATPVVLNVQDPIIHNTTVVVSCTPNPVTTGNSVACSVTVAAQ